MLEEAELVSDNAMKKGKGPFTIARECFMVYLKKRRFDLALKLMEAAVSEILENKNRLDSDDYHWSLRTYVAAGKVAPDMCQGLVLN
ncbi:hypothetical protein DITRI_Ditri11bG0119200 [Diplodiscus trichospermus]